MRKQTWADRSLTRRVTVLAVVAIAFPAAIGAQEAPLTAAAAPAPATAPRTPTTAPTSCVVCHSNADLFGADAVREIVEAYRDGVHAQVGLSCHDCHGGNPDAALAEDNGAAMDPESAANP